MTNQQPDQQNQNRHTNTEYARLIDAATAALETIQESHQDDPGDEDYKNAAHCATHAANLWNALLEHTQNDPQVTLIAARGKQDCMDAAQSTTIHCRGVASTKEFLAEQIARAVITWSNQIAATLRGRNCDLLIHVTESQGEIAIWAEELDPNELPYDPAAKVHWIPSMPEGADQQLRRQYHPKAARTDRIAQALRLQHTSYSGGQVTIQTHDGTCKAPAVVMTTGEARKRLGEVTAPNAHVAIRMGPETTKWLNGQ